MFFNISLKHKAKWIVITSIITIIILFISIISMIKLIDKIQNGEIFNKEIDLTFRNYYTKYDMTVISNKNINTYAVKEWHKAEEITKLEYLDYMKNTVTIILENNTCNISNSGNTAKLVINNMIGNKNIASLSTFGYLYNLDCNKCNCNKEKYIKNDEIVVKIEFKEGCDCECNKIIEDIGVHSLELVIKDSIPKNYIIYGKNKKEYISIVYNVFDTNI